MFRVADVSMQITSTTKLDIIANARAVIHFYFLCTEVSCWQIRLEWRGFPVRWSQWLLAPNVAVVRITRRQLSCSSSSVARGIFSFLLRHYGQLLFCSSQTAAGVSLFFSEDIMRNTSLLPSSAVGDASSLHHRSLVTALLLTRLPILHVPRRPREKASTVHFLD